MSGSRMFWKRNQKPDLLNEPRAHHYALGHVAFRMFCDSDPLAFFKIMASEKKNAAINILWESVCEQCDLKEKADIKPEDVRITLHTIDNYPVVLIEMPEVKAILEAIMIAVVLSVKISELESADTINYRYLVLEQGVDLNGNGRTVFCEWSDEIHFNMGDGCNPDAESFVEFLSHILKQSKNG